MNPPLNPDFSTPINLPDFSGLDLNFEIIDAHHHLFDLDEVYYPWLTDEPEKHFLLTENVFPVHRSARDNRLRPDQKDDGGRL